MAASAEPIRDIAHLGHVELLTPKPEESYWYFTDVLGMDEVHREGRSVYLRGYADYAVSTLKLTEEKHAGIGHISWRAVSPAALERRAKAIEEAGLGVGWTNGDFGHGKTYQFRDPDGHLMEIYYEEQRYVPPDEAHRSTLMNLPQRFSGNGIGVKRTDHVALLCQDVGPNREFAENVLGLKLREKVVYENGTKEIGSWMSNTAMHHEMAYVLDVKGAHGRLHHFSLWVDDKSDVLRAADICMENGITIEAGPSKHNNSQAFYLYMFEPGGNRVEVFSSGFFVFAPDFEPIVWNEETRGGGVYWGADLPESFLNYATPDVEGPVRDDVSPIDPK